MRSRWMWTAACLTLVAATLGVRSAPAQKAPAPGDGRELVAVLELDGVNTGKPELAALTEELRAQLLQTGKFRVVDRQQIDAILKEQAFQQTGCTSQECAAQVGKILGVRKMIVGRVTRINDSLWQVAAQMVDAESAETVRAETLNHEGKFDTLLTQGMTALAGKLTGGASPAAQIASGQPGQTWRDPITGMEFVWVPGGTFEMGCGGPWAGKCYKDERPVHTVKLSAFWLGKTEVTQGQWKTIMENNPSVFSKGDDYPVDTVSWTDAQEFVQGLNTKSSGVTFRLPTEAEWEYACRGGGKDVTYGTKSGEINRFLGNIDNMAKSTTAVAKYPPNSLGLYDMSGNVWEWVQDADADYSVGAIDNPAFNNRGTERILRGGGWSDGPRYARCTNRGSETPEHRDDGLGLRVARNP